MSIRDINIRYVGVAVFGAILATIGAIIGLSYQVPVLGFVEFFVTASQVIGIIMFVVGTVKALYPIMK